MSNTSNSNVTPVESNDKIKPTIETKKSEETKKDRCIGRWKICETLGKGGYSCVKKGIDKKTGKIVALKFMKKADKSWAKEQHKQVVTEIECLKQVRHKNILKLYAYNLNAKYPASGDNNEKIEAILLVLEFAPGGEIFDILYYTEALETILCRTYFRQAILGLEACHLASVTHRDLKPQNLLLDWKFNLKICDFGLSKVFESDADSIMKTTYVGTRGYQAPELLLNKPYDMSCDIFSLGVVMFILINGYPPFEEADVTDYWFSPLVNNDAKKFWKLHKKCNIRKDEKCKNLMSRMLAFNPKDRISIQDIKKHPWYIDQVLTSKELIRVLKVRHANMEIKREEDGRKAEDLVHSFSATKHIEYKQDDLPVSYPSGCIEAVDCNELYSYHPWKKILSFFYNVVATQLNGHVVYKDMQLICRIKPVSTLSKGGNSNASKSSQSKSDNSDNSDNSKSETKTESKSQAHDENVIEFSVSIFNSSQFMLETSKVDKDDVKPEEATVYIVRTTKIKGETHKWVLIRKKLFVYCHSVISGLPEWARKINQSDLGIKAHSKTGSATDKIAQKGNNKDKDDDGDNDNDDNNNKKQDTKYEDDKKQYDNIDNDDDDDDDNDDYLLNEDVEW